MENGEVRDLPACCNHSPISQFSAACVRVAAKCIFGSHLNTNYLCPQQRSCHTYDLSKTNMKVQFGIESLAKKTKTSYRIRKEQVPWTVAGHHDYCQLTITLLLFFFQQSLPWLMPKRPRSNLDPSRKPVQSTGNELYDSTCWDNSFIGTNSLLLGLLKARVYFLKQLNEISLRRYVKFFQCSRLCKFAVDRVYSWHMPPIRSAGSEISLCGNSYMPELFGCWPRTWDKRSGAYFVYAETSSDLSRQSNRPIQRKRAFAEWHRHFQTGYHSNIIPI